MIMCKSQEKIQEQNRNMILRMNWGDKGSKSFLLLMFVCVSVFRCVCVCVCVFARQDLHLFLLLSVKTRDPDPPIKCSSFLLTLFFAKTDQLEHCEIKTKLNKKSQIYVNKFGQTKYSNMSMYKMNVSETNMNVCCYGCC